jgi:hypothetical protein
LRLERRKAESREQISQIVRPVCARSKKGQIMRLKNRVNFATRSKRTAGISILMLEPGEYKRAGWCCLSSLGVAGVFWRRY